MWYWADLFYLVGYPFLFAFSVYYIKPIKNISKNVLLSGFAVSAVIFCCCSISYINCWLWKWLGLRIGCIISDFWCNNHVSSNSWNYSIFQRQGKLPVVADLFCHDDQRVCRYCFYIWTSKWLLLHWTSNWSAVSMVVCIIFIWSIQPYSDIQKSQKRSIQKRRFEIITKINSAQTRSYTRPGLLNWNSKLDYETLPWFWTMWWMPCNDKGT